MTAGQRRYVAIEAAIGAAINAVLSMIFAVLVFHGQARVPVAALVFDALPQSFMVTLMSMIVPTLLTRRRLATGAVEPLPVQIGRGPGGLAVRTIGVAVAVAVLAWIAHRLLLPALLAGRPAYAPVLTAKILYGALLGAVVTATTVRAALAGR